MELAGVIEYLRKREGLSQQELADKLGVSRSTIGMIESGQRMPGRETLETIADTFNVSIDFLAGRVDSGIYSSTFRDRLSEIISSSNHDDLVAAGIDLYEANLVIDGALSLTFEYACDISDKLGVSLDEMLGKENPASMDRGEVLTEISLRVSRLSEEQRSAALQYIRFLSESEEK